MNKKQVGKIVDDYIDLSYVDKKGLQASACLYSYVMVLPKTRAVFTIDIHKN